MINKKINYFKISIKIFTILVLFFFTFKLKAENISDFELEKMWEVTLRCLGRCQDFPSHLIGIDFTTAVVLEV